MAGDWYPYPYPNYMGTGCFPSQPAPWLITATKNVVLQPQRNEVMPQEKSKAELHVWELCLVDVDIKQVTHDPTYVVSETRDQAIAIFCSKLASSVQEILANGTSKVVVMRSVPV